jgi:hypothetical protein
MEVHRENSIPGVQGGMFTADSPEKWFGVCIKEANPAQNTPGEPMFAEYSSSEILRRYLKHVGISRKRKRYHCLTQELHRLFIS